MPFNFFKQKPKRQLSDERIEYVKKYAYTKKQDIIPCDKFIACYEKLTRGYVLCLTEPEQNSVVGVTVLEFNENYDFKLEYTTELREKLVLLSKNCYFLTINLIQALSVLEQSVENKNEINKVKLDVRVVSDVVLNIYKHLSMLDEIPQFEDDDYNYPKNANDLVDHIKNIFDELINDLIKLNDMIKIDYLNKQLTSLILKLQQYKSVF